MEADINVVDGQVDGRVIAESASIPATIDLGFEEQFDGLYARAYGVAFQLLGRRTEAEDVAQETLARCFAWFMTLAAPRVPRVAIVRSRQCLLAGVG